jgi:8-oxo-dGTP diphosphatase
MEVYAAGAVCWREEKRDLLVAIVHRVRYQDWTFPKGKVDPGETLAETAVREIKEETCSEGFLPRNFHQSGKKVLGPNQTAPMMIPTIAATAVANRLISIVKDYPTSNFDAVYTGLKNLKFGFLPIQGGQLWTT